MPGKQAPFEDYIYVERPHVTSVVLLLFALGAFIPTPFFVNLLNEISDSPTVSCTAYHADVDFVAVNINTAIKDLTPVVLADEEFLAVPGATRPDNEKHQCALELYHHLVSTGKTWPLNQSLFRSASTLSKVVRLGYG